MVEAEQYDGGVNLTVRAYARLIDEALGDPRTKEFQGYAHAALEARPDPNMEAYVARFDATLHKHYGDVASALDALEIGLSALDAASDRTRGRLQVPMLIDHAELSIVLGSFAEAEETLRRAQEGVDVDDVRQRIALANVHGAWVEFYLKLGRYDRAKPHLEAERVAAFSPGGSDRTKSAWALHRAAAGLSISDSMTLLQEIDEVLESARWLAPGAPARGQLLVRRGLAEYHMELERPGGPRLARATLESALSWDLPRLDEHTARRTLARICLADGDYGGAAKWIRGGRELVESWRSDGTGAPWIELAEIAGLETQLALGQGLEGNALEAILDRTEQDGAVFLERWNRIAKDRGELAVLQFTTRQNILGAWVDARLARSSDADAGAMRYALELALRALSIGQLAGELGVDALSDDVNRTLEALIPDGGGVLVYLPSLLHSHVFACDQRGVAHFELPVSVKLERGRDRLTDAIDAALLTGGREAQARLDTAAEHLGSALLPVGLARLMEEWQGLVVIGLDTLGYVPFECLLVSGELLGDRMPIAYMPSAAVASALLARRSAAPAGGVKDLMLFAAPEHGTIARARWPRLSTLPWDDGRANMLTGAYDPSRLEVVLGLLATPVQLAARDLAQAAVLQIVAHGAYDASLDRPPIIVMAAGPGDQVGLLTGDLVRGLGAVPSLVVLTTCGAALSPLRPGEDGSAHLGGAFLASGAQCVVLSRTDVRYDASMELMARFHQNLVKERLSPARALFRARLSLRDHPTFGRVECRSLVHAIGLGFDTVPGVASAQRATRDRGAMVPRLLSIAAVVVALSAIIALGLRYRRTD